MIHDDYNIVRCLSMLILFFCFADRIAGFSTNHHPIRMQTRVFRKNNVHLASSGGDEALESLAATVETTSTSLFSKSYTSSIFFMIIIKILNSE